MSTDELVGVVMAAGESSRFGTAKQLLPFGDTTLLGHVVRNANRSTLDRYDTSRNHSRRWCSMESCGNRAKAKRHYRRMSEPINNQG